MKPLIILSGPTAAGKSKLSIALAKAVGGEIISADSMQVYKYMDIGTAKTRPEEMEGIPHYLIDLYDPSETFHVARFQELALEAMDCIYAKGKLPIITGGTGFYIQSILYQVDFREETADPAFREEMGRAAQEKGTAYLHEMLQKIDPASADAIHANNQKRIIRALEYHHHTKGRISEHNLEQKNRKPAYQFVYFVLTKERESLYQSIDQRVDEMLSKGLVEEVRLLKQNGYGSGLVSMQGIGYKEISGYLDGMTSYEEAVRILKRETRRYAKRQLTWFRREKDVVWIDQSLFADEDAVLQEMLRIAAEKKILSR